MTPPPVYRRAAGLTPPTHPLAPETVLAGLSVSFTPNGVAQMHTPGPWTVDDSTLIIPANGGGSVAEAYGDTTEQAEANARLIAQSPNLLDLLTESLMYVEECEEFHKESCRTLSKRIRAAIEAINPT